MHDPRSSPSAASASSNKAPRSNNEAETDAASRVLLGGRDPAAEIAYFSLVSWLLGEPDRALDVTRGAVQRARDLGDPFTRGLTVLALGRVQFMRRDPSDDILATARLMPEAGSAWHVHEAHVMVVSANSHRTPLATDAAGEFVAGFRRRMTQFPLGVTIVALPVIDALRRSGHAAQAAAITDEALAFARTHGEQIVEPELLRLLGAARESTDRDGAGNAYLEAIALARAMQARSLELRAAIDLVMLWRDTDRRAIADEYLAAAIAGLTGAVDTPELAAARRLRAS